MITNSLYTILWILVFAMIACQVVLISYLQVYKQATLEMDTVSNDNLDIEFENNTKLYLTECFAFAHIGDDTLQNEMKEYFSNANKFDTKNINVHYQ